MRFGWVMQKHLDFVEEYFVNAPREKFNWIKHSNLGSISYYGVVEEQKRLCLIEWDAGLTMDWHEGGKHRRDDEEVVSVQCGDLRFLLDLARECLRLQGKVEPEEEPCVSDS